MPLKVAVIGAGGIGSAAARFIAREGHAVTVLEQFEADHDRGGSWGSSRIIRKTYADRLYTELMTSAYPLWEELEKEAGEELFVRTGGLFFGPAGHPDVITARAALEQNRVPFEVLDAGAVAKRFPEMRLREDEIGVHELDAGFLRASACVRANLRLARASGAMLRERTLVRAIKPSLGHVTIELADSETLDVDGVVVATGSWSRRFLASFVHLPLVVSRQVYCHFRPRTEPHAFGEGRFPVWIDLASLFYGFPESNDPQGVKVALHVPGVPTDPDLVDRIVHASDRQPLIEYCSRRFPGLSSEILFEKVCLYANSPDDDFIIDTFPNDPRIVMFAGDSGHGLSAERALEFVEVLGHTIRLFHEVSALPSPPSRRTFDRWRLSGAMAAGS
jgi:monomeric sarcosine oxidase